MAMSKSRKRREKRRRQQKQHAARQAEQVSGGEQSTAANPELPEPGDLDEEMGSEPEDLGAEISGDEPAVPASDARDNLDLLQSMIASLEDGDVLVDLECENGDTRRQAYVSLSVPDAAEQLASQYVSERLAENDWPIGAVSVTCFTRLSQFGPFLVDIDLVIDAKELRGNRDSD